MFPSSILYMGAYSERQWNPLAVSPAHTRLWLMNEVSSADIDRNLIEDN